MHIIHQTNFTIHQIKTLTQEVLNRFPSFFFELSFKQYTNLYFFKLCKMCRKRNYQLLSTTNVCNSENVLPIKKISF